MAADKTHTHSRTFEDNAASQHEHAFQPRPLIFHPIFRVFIVNAKQRVRIISHSSARTRHILLSNWLCHIREYIIQYTSVRLGSYRIASYRIHPHRIVVTVVISRPVPFRLLPRVHLSLLCLGYLMLQLIPDLSASPRIQKQLPKIRQPSRLSSIRESGLTYGCHSSGSG